MKYALAACFFLLLSLFSIHGQEVTPSYFRVLTLGSQKSDLFFSQVPPPGPDPENPKESLPASPDYTETLVPVSTNSRSPFIAFKKTAPLYFIIHEGHLYKTVASINTLENLSLLLIQPGTNPEQAAITVLPDDPVRFPGGAFEVVNLSSHDVTVKLASQLTIVKRSANTIVVPPVKEDDRLSVEVFRASEPQYSNVARYNKHLRFIMFIIDVKGALNHIEFEKLIDSPESAVTPSLASDGH